MRCFSEMRNVRYRIKHLAIFARYARPLCRQLLRDISELDFDHWFHPHFSSLLRPLNSAIHAASTPDLKGIQNTCEVK